MLFSGEVGAVELTPMVSKSPRGGFLGHPAGLEGQCPKEQCARSHHSTSRIRSLAWPLCTHPGRSVSILAPVCAPAPGLHPGEPLLRESRPHAASWA